MARTRIGLLILLYDNFDILFSTSARIPSRIPIAKYSTYVTSTLPSYSYIQTTCLMYGNQSNDHIEIKIKSSYILQF